MYDELHSGAVGELVAYSINNGTVTLSKPNYANTARAIYVETDEKYTSNSSFAFITGNYTKSTVGNETIYTYPVVLEDGTVTTLASRTDSGLKDSQVHEYQTDGSYYSFDGASQSRMVNKLVVTGLGSNAISVADVENDAIRKDSFAINNVTVWNVQDTGNVFKTSLAKNQKAALVLTDGATFNVAADNYTLKVTVPAALKATITIGGEKMQEDATGSLSCPFTVDAGAEVAIAIAVKPADEKVSATTRMLKYTVIGNAEITPGGTPEETEQQIKDSFDKGADVSVTGDLEMTGGTVTITEAFTGEISLPPLPAGQTSATLTIGDETTSIDLDLTNLTVPEGYTVTLNGLDVTNNVVVESGHTLNVTGDLNVTGNLILGSSTKNLTGRLVIGGTLTVSGEFSATKDSVIEFKAGASVDSELFTNFLIGDDVITAAGDVAGKTFTANAEGKMVAPAGTTPPAETATANVTFALTTPRGR